LGGITLMGGAGLSILGLLLLRFPQIDIGALLNIVGMFLIAIGLLMLSLRFTGLARTLTLAALIVFTLPLIGYTIMTIYTPGFLEQVSVYVLSDQEQYEIAYTVLASNTILWILSFGGLIIAGMGILRASGSLLRWTGPVGWTLIATSGMYILLRLLSILQWLPDNQALETVFSNLVLVLFILINLLLASLGYALLAEPVPGGVITQVAMEN
jgi:hypothetical protein